MINLDIAWLFFIIATVVIAIVCLAACVTMWRSANKLQKD